MSTRSSHRLFTVTLLALALALIACKSDDTGDATDAGRDAGSMGNGFPKPEPDDCITSVKAGKQMAIACEGLKLELSVPKACLSKACGLITDVHGFGMDGPAQEFNSQMDEHGEKHDFIVIHPSSPGTGLSASWSMTGGNDDQVLAIMQHVIDVFHVDPERVHMSGYSQGGFMTWRFLCKHSDLLASVAPMSAGTGAGSCAFSATDKPEHERSILYVHGTTDGLVSFSTAGPQRDAVIAAWKMTKKEVVSEGDDHVWTRYDDESGTVFEFMQHDWETSISLGTRPLLGHCFPGGPGLLSCGKETATTMEWGKAVVEFFVAHPRGKS